MKRERFLKVAMTVYLWKYHTLDKLVSDDDALAALLAFRELVEEALAVIGEITPVQANEEK